MTRVPQTVRPDVPKPAPQPRPGTYTVHHGVTPPYSTAVTRMTAITLPAPSWINRPTSGDLAGLLPGGFVP
jgi:hypothetical protein